MLIVVLVVTVLFVLFLRTNPTGREFFDPARTCQNLIAVKLLRQDWVVNIREVCPKTVIFEFVDFLDKHSFLVII